MSKYMLYGIFLQSLFCSMLIAANGQAQNTSIREVYLSLNLQNATLGKAFKEIKSKTGFHFAYSRELVNDQKKVNVTIENSSLATLLYEISHQTGLSFKRVNENIHVARRQPEEVRLEELIVENIVVKGKVTDESGEGLPGVNILIKGTDAGAITDYDGNYSLEAPEDGVLVFSIVGFVSEEIPVNGRSEIILKMVPDILTLQEMVVIGYGVQKKENVSGAISQVGSEVFENRATPDIAQSLQGIIPNLNVVITDGSPNADPDFNIRGFESLNGGEPLILVDGVPFESFNDLNPDDIKSVTVLKDAASAAIYGARAAFGVVLITTKMGGKNRPVQVNISSSYTLSDLIVTPNPLNSVESATAANLSRTNANQSVIYTDEHLEYMQAYLDDPVNNPSWFLLNNGNYQTAGNLNVYEEAYSNFAVRQTNNISLNGGSEKSSFYASLGYITDKGQWRENPDEKKRYNTLLKYNYEVNDWLSLNFKGGYNKVTYQGPHGYAIGSYWHALERSKPWQLVTTPEGFPEGEGLPMNHTLTFQRIGGRDLTTSQETYLTGNIILNPFKGFTFNLDYTHINNTQQIKNHQKRFAMINDNTPETPFYGQSATSYLLRRSDITTRDILDVYASYNITVENKHNFSLLLGYNQTSSEYLRQSSWAFDLIKQDFPALSLANGLETAGDENTFTAIRGVFGRFNYNYDEKYFIEINARYDGSDVFPEANRYGFFPSVSGAWIVSNESFFEDVPVVSYLKLRGSYGSLGNQSIDPDLFRPLLGTGAVTNYLIDGERPIAVTAADLVSNDLTWETSTTMNFGIDVGFLDNRLTASLDIYKRVVSDMIVAGQPLPGVLGTNAPQTNAADLETKGFEFEISWRESINKDFSYGISANLSDSRATITKYDLNPEGLFNTRTNNQVTNIYEGMEWGEIWGYETVGIFQTQDQVDAAPDQSQVRNVNWEPGDVQYADLDGDGSITVGESTIYDPGDRKIIGNGRQRYNYAVTANVDYKGFDLNLFFRGVGKKDIYILNSSPVYWGHSGVANNRFSTGNHWALDNSWTPENPDAKLPVYESNSTHNSQIQTRFLENGAFLRLKSAVLGYTFPAAIASRIKLDKVRVYLSGQNLWTKDNLYGLFDPEVLGNYSYNDGKVYPNRRSFSLGLQITL